MHPSTFKVAAYGVCAKRIFCGLNLHFSSASCVLSVHQNCKCRASSARAHRGWLNTSTAHDPVLHLLHQAHPAPYGASLLQRENISSSWDGNGVWFDCVKCRRGTGTVCPGALLQIEMQPPVFSQIARVWGGFFYFFLLKFPVLRLVPQCTSFVSTKCAG